MLFAGTGEAASPTPTPTPLMPTPPTPTPVLTSTPPSFPTPESADAPGGGVPPHLGYGIHIGPYSPVPLEMIYALNVDWVKLYDVPQLDDYPGLRVLYRMDIHPRDGDDLEHFRAEIMKRTREVMATHPVEAIEVGNEPNLVSEWPPMPNPAEFTRMLCAAYSGIKAVAPGVIVVSGGLAPGPNIDGAVISDMNFAVGMLQAGAEHCFDVFGYHPYGFNLPPEADPYQQEYSFRRAERMRALLVEQGMYKQIWMTEFGWLRSPREEGIDCDGAPGFQGFEWMQFPSEVVAGYVVNAFDYADRYWPWAGPMFLWNLDWQLYAEDYLPRCDQMRWFGILDQNGNPSEVYRAVAASSRRFSNYTPELATHTDDMTEVVEAFCPEQVEVGMFTVENMGYPAPFAARIEPVVGPGIPATFTSRTTASAGQSVEVFVDTHDVEPGMHLIVVNVVTFHAGRRLSTNVRGWVLAQPSTRPECGSE